MWPAGCAATADPFTPPTDGTETLHPVRWNERHLSPMSPAQFEASYSAQWDELEALLAECAEMRDLWEVSADG